MKRTCCRFLTVREQRLRTRRLQAEELLAWKDQLDHEEKEVKLVTLYVTALKSMQGERGKTRESDSVHNQPQSSQRL